VKGSETAEIAELSPIEASPRHLQAVEFTVGDDGDDAPAELPEGGTAATP
jgi:hypothetical protein